MKLTEFMDERYTNREDKDNMYGVGVSDTEFRAFIIDYLLGEDWYVVDPLGQTQINEIALYEILEKHSKRYRKERRNDFLKKRFGIPMVKDRKNDVVNKIYERMSTIDKAISEDELKIEGMKEAYTDCLEIINNCKAESEV